MPQSSDPEPPGPSRRRDPLIGALLDERYLIEERIAIGGFGAIYRARTAGGERVAIKILHPWLVGDPNMVARFRREGATLTQLHDPHTVATLAVGEADGVLYIAMELLTGEGLDERLRRLGALPWRAAVAIARAVCSSLAEAHALGVVHRDLKPANIHVERRGDRELVKVIDFGIVKIARGSSIDDGHELTHAGHMIGTFEYMSPEQILGEPCLDRSDVYALGVVLYEMLAGRRPFPKVATPAAQLTAVLTQTPIRPSELAAIPDALDRIAMRCLGREPAERFAGVAELAAALDGVVAAELAADEVTAVHADPSPTVPDRVPFAVCAGSPDDERTWIDQPQPAAPTAIVRAPRMVIHATLPGVAVSTEAREPSAPRIAAVMPPWPLAPPPIPWQQPPEPLARGSRPHLPAPTHGALWIALVMACLVAIAIALLAR